MRQPLKYTCIEVTVQYYVIRVIKYVMGRLVESWLNKRNDSLMISNRWTYLWPGNSQTQRDTLEHIYTKGFTCIIHSRIHTHTIQTCTHTHTNSGYHRTELYPLVQSHTPYSHMHSSTIRALLGLIQCLCLTAPFLSDFCWLWEIC